jgi:hypothetical protein
MVPADPVGDTSTESRSTLGQEDDLAVASTWMRADELTSRALANSGLDPTIAFVVFPAGRQPAHKARVFVGYLKRAVMHSQISPFREVTGSTQGDSFYPRHLTSAVGAFCP